MKHIIQSPHVFLISFFLSLKNRNNDFYHICAVLHVIKSQITKQHEIHLTNAFILMLVSLRNDSHFFYLFVLPLICCERKFFLKNIFREMLRHFRILFFSLHFNHSIGQSQESVLCKKKQKKPYKQNKKCLPHITIVTAMILLLLTWQRPGNKIVFC